MCSNLSIGVSLSLTNNRNAITGANLFVIPIDNDITVFFIQFNGVADASGLFTGNQCGTTASERVEDDAVNHAGIHNGIRDERNGLHGWVVAIFLWLIKFPDGSLLAACIPLMFSGFLPAEQARLMLPLIRATAQHQRLFFPDASAGKIKPSIREGLTEIQPFSVRVEHIDAGVIRHCMFHLCESVQQELVEGIVCHVVVPDFSGAALIVDIVRRIGHYQIGFFAIHQKILEVLLLRHP